MDVKTHALDRVLEALAPALASELDRLVQETREGLDQEFQARLQTSVREAEMTATAALQAHLERAVEEAREETRHQVAAELEQQFNNRLEAAATELRNEAAEERAQLEASISRLKDEWSAERARLQDQIEQWRTFSEVQRQLAEASSQPEILSRFLRLAEPFAEGLAVYVSKSDGLALWKSRGTGDFPETVSQQTSNEGSYFRVIRVRGQSVGAISASPPFKAEVLDFLAVVLERAIEIFGVKLRSGSK